MSTALDRTTNFFRFAVVLTCVSLGCFACSKRNPKIDTSTPAIKPSGTGGSGGTGGSDNVYIPPTQSTGTTGGNNNVTPPSNNTTSGGNNNNNNNNDDVTPPSNNTTTGGNSNNDDVTPPGNDTNPDGNNEVNPPNGNNSQSTEAQVPAKVTMTNQGPQVSATLPSDATDVMLTYKSITGSTSGTTITIDLNFKKNSKTCAISNATVTQQEATLKLPCT